MHDAAEFHISLAIVEMEWKRVTEQLHLNYLHAVLRASLNHKVFAVCMCVFLGSRGTVMFILGNTFCFVCIKSATQMKCD